MQQQFAFDVKQFVIDVHNVKFVFDVKTFALYVNQLVFRNAVGV